MVLFKHFKMPTGV